MLNRELFKESLGTYYEKLTPLFDRGVMDDIFSTLKKRSKEGYKILPESSLTFRCFTETPLSELKAVMIGMAPYYTMRNNVPIADGLLMGCSLTDYVQPSLDKFYGGLEREFSKGLNLKMDKTPDVSYLAKQGVLMYNISLTTELGKTGAHIKLWKPFTIFLLEEIISLTGVPVIFLGADAARYKRHLAPMQWHFELSHPASASHTMSDWETKGVFTKVSRIVKNNNNEDIKWIKEH